MTARTHKNTPSVFLILLRMSPLYRQAFPCSTNRRVLLDGEKLLHTRDAQAAMREEGVALLTGWPSKSPDLNPQENVWAWAEDDLRKSERKRDTVAVFNRRVAASCQRYPSKLALVPSMAGRMAKCVRLRGANLVK